MEERAPLPANENQHHHPSHPRQPESYIPSAEYANPDSFSETSDQRAKPEPIPDPNPEVLFRPGTFVVQVPKDQIYRVPAPEHALIVERRRRSNQPQRKRSRSTLHCCAFISVVALILGLAGGISYIFLKHKNPTFRVESVLVKKPSSDHRRRERPEYDVGLKVHNPNKYVRVFYDEGGDALLSYYDREIIAVGKYPTFDQAPGDSTAFKMIFRGLKILLPREIEKSMEKGKKKVHVSLSVSVRVPIRMKIGAVKTGIKKISIDCDLRVDTLAKGTSVLSQECRTKS